ncbi:uncharacterized protein EDB93DRAFT_1337664 [Suillus bovinus]|uniref:uncharacterized protein n=1 Tax=Suillus bovinus TaxID=48563 RepID=UPI001B87ED38|nr:uncharacterized protein EDB93DRAFT_1337664 [Suillus bovinus]KAG2146100.1 hypothetical protein EDB93DRAFT_1337664 [Suillus bovinus]
MYWPQYEYGAVVMERLTSQITQVSSHECMKMVRKEQKMQAVADEHNLGIVCWREWPKSAGRSWCICDLEDSKGCYSALLTTYDLCGMRVQSLDICDERGVQIHVSEYKTKLKEGSIVELEVILKLWTIKPCSNSSNPCDANSSHIYQMMLQHMQLLPCEKYMQAAFVNLIKDGKGKRKAADKASETMSQSPTKKGSFSAVVGDKLEYMEE